MNIKKIIWTEPAINDLDDIIEYISIDSVNIAIDIYEKIIISIENTKDFPEQGRVIPELEYENIKKYREIISSPWRIFYKIENMNMIILAIIDGRRNIEDILIRRNLR